MQPPLPTARCAWRERVEAVLEAELDALLEQALAAAESALSQRLEQAISGEERRALIDLLHQLPLERPQLRRTLAEAHRRACSALPGPAPAAPPDAAEAATLATLRELLQAAAGAALTRWQQIVDQRRREGALGLRAGLLAPADLIAAWQEAALRLEPDPVRRVLLHRRVGEIWAVALARLYPPLQAALAPGEPIEPAPGAEPARAESRASGAEGSAPLRRWLEAQRDQTRVAADRALLDALLEGPLSRSPAIRQRLQLLGRLLGDPREEPLNLASSALARPLLKLALADDSCFDSPQHPARSLLAEARTAAALSGLTPGSERGRSERLLAQLAQTLELSADFVLARLPRLPLLDERVEPLLQAQLAAEQAEREARCEREARRWALQRLEQESLGRALPAPLLDFLQQHWVPAVARLLREDGVESLACAQALVLLARLLDRADGHWTAPLLADLRALLAGQDPALGALQALLDQRPWAPPARPAPAAEPALIVSRPLLPAAVAAAHPPAPAAAPPRPAVDPPGPVAGSEALLQPGRWFRLQQPGRTLWLRLGATAQPEWLRLTGFDDRTVLRLSRAALLEALARGEAEPLDPGERGSRALAALRAQAARETGAVRR
ncbi:MAG TPA: hypothetical protein VFV27_02445 [Nevskiaceae bacterium]|nr:hypothetical protein [Nevskiaceae bacterium]